MLLQAPGIPCNTATDFQHGFGSVLQVTLAVNKCENAAVADQQAADFWALGLEPIAVSAISGSGTGDLLDHLTANLPAPRDGALEVELDRSQVAVAIVGRPNVGKSSLVNAITGEHRAGCDRVGCDEPWDAGSMPGHLKARCGAP